MECIIVIANTRKSLPFAQNSHTEMESPQLQLHSGKDGSNYDRQKDLKAFDESKAGVKGLVDSGIVEVPSIFVRPLKEVMISCESKQSDSTNLQIPVVDLKGLHEHGIVRNKIIDEIRQASESWGFFQVVNHGISIDVLHEMIEGVQKFHELPKEEKLKYYSFDNHKKVRYNSNYNLYESKAADWRDSSFFVMEPEPPSPEEFPEVCRDITISYSAQVKGLGLTLFELLAEALGLKPNHLLDIDCAKGHHIVCHYCPPCPEPHRTLGGTAHKDISFITILLQDHIGGLQVFHQNQWVDIDPVPGAFVINIGDLLQLLSNAKFKSSEHRVVSKLTGPRISVAFFFSAHMCPSNRLYGPIKELLSDENPPLYQEILLTDYFNQFVVTKHDDGVSVLDHLTSETTWGHLHHHQQAVLLFELAMFPQLSILLNW